MGAQRAGNLAESSLDSLVKEFDSNILDLVKQKKFYPYKYMSNFKKFKEQLPSK